MSSIARSREWRKREKEWQERFNALAPKLGDVAPDFGLRDTRGKNRVRVSDLRGLNPVALIFGSFT